MDLDYSDLEAIVAVRPNVLVCGHRHAADAFLSSLSARYCAQFREVHVASLRAGTHVGERTAVLRNVADCSLAEQKMLLDWLEGQERQERRMQLITTTDRRLFDLVDKGLFDARLFYRLNMIYVDLMG